MIVRLDIEAGVCGFRTLVRATANEEQAVHLTIESDCANIQNLARQLKGHEPIDSLQEIDASSHSVILSSARECLKGCCAGCIVPAGLFKSLQVAAGLTLPKDIRLQFAQE